MHSNSPLQHSNMTAANGPIEALVNTPDHLTQQKHYRTPLAVAALHTAPRRSISTFTGSAPSLILPAPTRHPSHLHLEPVIDGPYRVESWPHIQVHGCRYAGLWCATVEVNDVAHLLATTVNNPVVTVKRQLEALWGGCEGGVELGDTAWLLVSKKGSSMQLVCMPCQLQAGNK